MQEPLRVYRRELNPVDFSEPTMSEHRTHLTNWYWLCFALASACSGSDSGGPNPPETLGTSFTPAGAISDGAQLAWTAGGTELLFTSGPDALQPLESFRLADGSVTTIDARLRIRGPLTVTRGGQWVCTYADPVSIPDSAAYDCVDRTTGSVITLSTRPAYGLLVYAALTATADSLVAYGVLGSACAGIGYSTCDSLYLYNSNTGAHQFLRVGLPDAFSPDGQELLYRDRPCDEMLGLNTCPLFVLDLQTQQASSIWPGATTDLVWLTRWDVFGARRVSLAKSTTGRYVDTLVIRDVVNRTTHTLRAVDDQRAEDISPSPVLSADGRVLAYWVIAVGELISYLEVLDLGTGISREVAIGYGTNAGHIALASDGKRIAYVFNRRGYWSSLQ